RRRRARGGTAAAPEPNGQAAVQQTSSFVPLPDKDRETLLHSARDAVIDLLGQVEGTIGVILPLAWPQEAWDVPDRVQLLDVLEAKGLEFDAAVIVAPEEIAAQSPMGLRTLYVAVSRATQRLTVLTTSPRWEAVLTGTSTTL
ncbi:ATP-binding domain-containing protein, partial [Actinocorallia lasiicapitis]